MRSNFNGSDFPSTTKVSTSSLIRRQAVLFVAFRAPAERPDVEINVAIKNLRKLSGEFGPAVTGTVATGDVSQVEVSPGARVVFGMSGFEKTENATLWSIAFPRVLQRRGSRSLGRGGRDWNLRGSKRNAAQ